MKTNTVICSRTYDCEFTKCAHRTSHYYVPDNCDWGCFEGGHCIPVQELNKTKREVKHGDSK